MQRAPRNSNQTFAHWFGDSLKALIVAMAMGVLFLWIPYLLLKKSPQRWWLYTSVASVPLLALVMLVQPVLIAPLFDDFGPMRDKALEAKILGLAERAGINGGRVFEVNKSEDAETLNAYVGGLLDAERIVLWDTLLRNGASQTRPFASALAIPASADRGTHRMRQHLPPVGDGTPVDIRRLLPRALTAGSAGGNVDPGANIYRPNTAKADELHDIGPDQGVAFRFHGDVEALGVRRGQSRTFQLQQAVAPRPHDRLPMGDDGPYGWVSRGILVKNRDREK